MLYHKTFMKEIKIVSLLAVLVHKTFFLMLIFQNDCLIKKKEKKLLGHNGV